MPFIRVKQIKGKKYAYLVENTWGSKGPRQKVKKYLGPIVELPIAEERPFTTENVEKKGFSQLAKEAIANEFLRRGFTVDEKGFIKDTITVTSTYEVQVGGRNAALRLNDGYFCDFTVAELLAYTGEDDPAGKRLARLIIACGVHPDEELFFELFSKSRPAEKQPEPIYY